MIQYSAASVIDPKRRGLLDARFRGMTKSDAAFAYATSDSFEALASTQQLRPAALAA